MERGRPQTISERVHEHIRKMHRVLALYDTPPTDGRVICVDGFGPLNLMPRKGTAWRPAGRPRRLRTTDHRYGGVMHMPAALDLVTGKIFYRISKRERWREFLGLLKALRNRRPGEKLYLVLDRFSPHKHTEIRTWAADNDAELVFLPTYGSWLNRNEAESAALRHFALDGTAHRTHAEQNATIAAYLRRRNARAEPKTNFAPTHLRHPLPAPGRSGRRRLAWTPATYPQGKR
ncbi:IS630 family transposase [Streptomyces noursei]|uniref:IS630 family transposase n=1 Tax=Streptomyces noursei TaxID=1971 RepID=UPI00196525C5|nr:IS630 family transposase [Streptomyces noursei]QRX97355.1 IS630 family transposase [Streptomyces noursei]